MSRRVVITGMGAVTPIGNNVEDFWANIKKGTVGIGPITKFDTSDYKAHLAAEVKDFDPLQYMEQKICPPYGRFFPVCSSSSQRGYGGCRTGYGKRRFFPRRMCCRMWNRKSAVRTEKLCAYPDKGTKPCRTTDDPDADLQYRSR